MGDLITEGFKGDLHYFKRNEFIKVINSKCSLKLKTSIFAYMCRLNCLYMIAKAGSGHIGSSFSSLDIISYIYLNEFKKGSGSEPIFFSSKGHDAPAFYSAQIGLGMLPFKFINQLRRLNGLPGHPDILIKTVSTNTGSLGMGVSKAKGFIQANRLKGIKKNIFVLTGDGELQEGRFWESLVSASNLNMGELTVIVDHNKFQSDNRVSDVNDLGDLEAKFKSFGWLTLRCDGNSINELSEAFLVTKKEFKKPSVIICDTVKGKGVSFMEGTSIDSDVELYKFHSGAPDKDSYKNAVRELSNKINVLISKSRKLNNLILSSTASESKNLLGDTQSMIAHYSNALISCSVKNAKIVSLDADLVLDTGLIPFKEKFPERFIECGIAEQDMVSQAGTLALSGYLPIVHSFSCFLTTRPYEQIYNNTSEKTKIIYVGSLAGLIPSGPGHSHQALRDISSMSSLPNMEVIAPTCSEEIQKLFDYAIRSTNSIYMRIESFPHKDIFKELFPESHTLSPGIGNTLIKGKDLVILCYGPSITVQAIEAANILSKKHDINISVVSVPWINQIDIDWLNSIIKNKHVLCLENHSTIGGLSDRVAKVILNNKLKLKSFNSKGIDSVPVCGTPIEVLEYYGLDSLGLVRDIRNLISKA